MIMQNCVFYRIYYQVSYPNPNQDSESNRLANIKPVPDINTNQLTVYEKFSFPVTSLLLMLIKWFYLSSIRYEQEVTNQSI